ncbi:MAG: hypothetical protein HC897_16205 [Thermoanaerobaculia bacterium]|nr:hypothetical protein [Thermoanaerobaculia bacterium]
MPYERLLAEPERECRRIDGFLSAFYDGASARSAGDVARMAATIAPGLWRNRSGSGFDEAPRATAAQKRLYSHLLAAVDASRMVSTLVCFRSTRAGVSTWSTWRRCNGS